MISENLKKAIILAYILTMVFSIISVVFFYIEKPYKETITCPQGIQMYSGGPFATSNSTCTVVPAQDPSPLMEAMIDLATVCGIALVILAGYAFYYNKHHPDTVVPEEPEEEESDGKD